MFIHLRFNGEGDGSFIYSKPALRPAKRKSPQEPNSVGFFIKYNKEISMKKVLVQVPILIEMVVSVDETAPDRGKELDRALGHNLWRDNKWKQATLKGVRLDELVAYDLQ